MKLLFIIYLESVILTVVTPSDAFWNNLPVLITSLVGALLGLGAFIRSGNAATKANDAIKVVTETKQELGVVHEKVNGTLAANILLAKQVGAAEAITILEKTAADKEEGVKEGIAQEKKEQAFREEKPK